MWGRGEVHTGAAKRSHATRTPRSKASTAAYTPERAAHASGATELAGGRPRCMVIPRTSGDTVNPQASNILNSGTTEVKVGQKAKKK